MIDHLVYATAELGATVDELAARLGVRPTPGGSHPGVGTRNHLADLASGAYLEVIGPDPAQPEPGRPRPFGIDHLSAPRLVTWAWRVEDLDAAVARASAAGLPPGEVHALSRRTPDGTDLRWRLTWPADPPAAEGLVPFLIEWGDSPHPSVSAPTGLRLAELKAEHPEPATVHRHLDALGVELPVHKGPAPRLVAVIDGPHGRVELS